MSGVVIYVQNSLNAERLESVSDYKDQVWVKIRLKGEDNLICVSIYRTPNNEILTSTTNQVNEMIKKVVDKESSHLLICGDYNYPEIDWNYSFAVRQSKLLSMEYRNATSLST